MVATPRPWKAPRKQRTSALRVRVGGDAPSWARKTALREERQAVVAATAARMAAHGAAAKAERERLQAKAERKEANRLRSAKSQIVRCGWVWRGRGMGEGARLRAGGVEVGGGALAGRAACQDCFSGLWGVAA